MHLSDAAKLALIVVKSVELSANRNNRVGMGPAPDVGVYGRACGAQLFCLSPSGLSMKGKGGLWALIKGNRK